MKKIVYSIFLLFICILSVNADGTSTYYIEANIQENGDMVVKELKILDGTYNGVKTNLRYKNINLKSFTGIKDDFEGSDIYNATNLIDLKVYDVIVGNDNFELVNNPNKLFEKVTSASIGDYGVYTEQYVSDGVNLLIYMPSSYKRASLVTYTLKDVVVVHNDIAEIAWDFIGENYEEDIKNLVIRVNLPTDSSELRVFSHGPLNGINRIVDNNTVELKYERLYSGNAVDMRVVFDKKIVPNSTKKSNINGLDYILEVEKERADEANTIRDEAYKTLEERAEESVLLAKQTLKKDDYELALYTVKLLEDGDKKTSLLEELDEIKIMIQEKKSNCQKKLYLSITGWFLGLGALVFFVYKKYDKEYDNGNYNDYYREIPNDYTPGIVSYLLYKEIKNEVFSASVMDLIRKEVLLVEEIIYEEKGIFKDKIKKDYKFIKNLEYDYNTLTSSEKKLLYLLINLVGDNKQVTLNNIKEYSKAQSTAPLFSKYYQSWNDIVSKEAKKKKFYEEHYGVKFFSIIYSLGLLVILIGFLNTEIDITVIYIMLIPMVLSIIYFSIYTKVTKKSIDDYRKWNGLKNYLKDFGSFDDKEILHINLWESYLVYATVFGFADKLQETMKVKVQNIENIDPQILSEMDNWHLHKMLSKSLNRSVNSAKRTTFTLNSIKTFESTMDVISTLAEVGTSTRSSSSGRGGGSSIRRGSGFGGGGSGGGRF